MDKVQRVGLVPHRTRLDAQRLAERAASWLTSRDVSVRIPRSDAAEGAFSEYLIDDDKFAAACDVVVSVGGDGTMLRAASLSFSGSLPLLGINAGRLRLGGVALAVRAVGGVGVRGAHLQLVLRCALFRNEGE